MTPPPLPQLLERFRGRRVLVTGHTGFKGSWLSIWLEGLGAEVTGLAIEPPSTPSLFDEARVTSVVVDRRGRIESFTDVDAAFRASAPEIVFHLAAQPIVTTGYADPVGTFATNVMGTVNTLEAARRHGTPATVIVTTDKVYENREWLWGYREDEPLGGRDPYSASKACAEIVTHAFRESYADAPGAGAIASARAGNVIGGGDWAADRIVPDMVRAFQQGVPVRLRRPGAIRPWQHVLDSLSGYLTLAALLVGDDTERSLAAQAWNFGPAHGPVVTVLEMAERFRAEWASGTVTLDGPVEVHEATNLSLSIEKAQARLGWSPRWDVHASIRRTAAWYRRHGDGADALDLCREDIAAYCTGD